MTLIEVELAGILVWLIALAFNLPTRGPSYTHDIAEANRLLREISVALQRLTLEVRLGASRGSGPLVVGSTGEGGHATHWSSGAPLGGPPWSGSKL